MPIKCIKISDQSNTSNYSLFNQRKNSTLLPPPFINMILLGPGQNSLRTFRPRHTLQSRVSTGIGRFIAINVWPVMRDSCTQETIGLKDHFWKAVFFNTPSKFGGIMFTLKDVVAANKPSILGMHSHLYNQSLIARALEVCPSTVFRAIKLMQSTEGINDRTCREWTATAIGNVRKVGRWPIR